MLLLPVDMFNGRFSIGQVDNNFLNEDAHFD